MGKDTTLNLLTLGWRVNRGLDPDYWLRPGAALGKHALNDLVTVPAKATGNHTAIVAQSGSGKSFFLGRLIEEIATKTKARCLILDPNGDFLQVNELAEDALWQTLSYDPDTRKGFLPTEPKSEFEAKWTSVTAMVRSAYPAYTIPVEQFELPWASLSPEFLIADLPPTLSSEVYHCHRFVQALAILLYGKALREERPLKLLDESEQLLRRQRNLSAENDVSMQRDMIKGQYSTDSLVRHLLNQRVSSLQEKSKSLFPAKPEEVIKKEFLESVHRPLVEESISQAIELCLRLPKYIGDDAARIYFGRARKHEEGNIFSATIEPHPRTSIISPQIEIVDLSSIIEPELRRLAVSSLIATEFERLRTARHQAFSVPPEEDIRCPTFLIVDEAHNLIPSGDLDKAKAALREQFRTIAAEGRKFGLFLILVTQRPDKLDAMVVSECENRAIMKLGSQAVLNTTREMLGLQEIPSKLLERTLEFDLGRGLLYGPWTTWDPTFFYCAGRRTRDGGRNLRPEHWAQP